MRRVAAADIQSGIGLGIALGLGVFQNLGKAAAADFHFGENVIAGAIENALHGVHAMRNQGFAQDADNGNAARHRRLELQLKIFLLRQFRQRLAMLGQQRLVGGHDMLAIFQRRLDELARHAFVAADQFDHHIGVRGRQCQRIGHPIADFKIALFPGIARAGRNNLDAPARLCRQGGLALRQRLDHAAAHRAEPGDGNL